LIFFSKIPVICKVWIGRITTYLFYGVSLIFFFSPNLKSALRFFSRLKDFQSVSRVSLVKETFFLALIISFIFLAVELLKNDYPDNYLNLEMFFAEHKIFFIVFKWALYFGVITALFLFSNKIQQFLYFQF
jgi:hypothetical protein